MIRREQSPAKLLVEDVPNFLVSMDEGGEVIRVYNYWESLGLNFPIRVIPNLIRALDSLYNAGAPK